jgi:hypothetical protein
MTDYYFVAVLYVAGFLSGWMLRGFWRKRGE